MNSDKEEILLSEENIINQQLKSNEVASHFTHEIFFSSKFSVKMEQLEELSKNKEIEILNLMYQLHDISRELELIKPSVMNQPSKKKHISNFNRIQGENDKMNNSNMIKMSNMSRRSISNGRIFEKNQNATTKNKVNVFSPKVSINIGGTDEISEKDLKFNKSIGKRNLKGSKLGEGQKSFGKNINETEEHGNHNTYNTNNKTNSASNKSGDVKKSSSFKSTPKNLKSGKLLNDKNTGETESKLIQNNLKGQFDLHEESTNSKKSTMGTTTSTIISDTNIHQNRVSFKFEPKKKLTNNFVSNNESITNSINDNRYDFSNNKSSFKSEENNQKTQKHIVTNSELFNSIKPKQLYINNHSNDLNSNILSFMSNINNKKIFMNIFTYLNLNNNLKVISRELRLGFLEQILKCIEKNKSLKTNQIENNKDDTTNLEMILELEIMTHNEDKIKGFIKHQ